MEFIKRIRFERLRIFKYSQEEGSRAAKMDGQISAWVKNKRHPRAMKPQKIARSEHDALDVDCRVLVKSPLPVGDFAEVTVTGSQVYDLVATTPEN